MLLSLLKLLLHLPFLALLLPLAAVAAALSTQARPEAPPCLMTIEASPCPMTITPHRVLHTACPAPFAPRRLQMASDTAVGIAWDSAGVTTGEVTTPLILALGLGVAKATMAPDGFGLLALASLGPVRSSGWRQSLVLSKALVLESSPCASYSLPTTSDYALLLTHCDLLPRPHQVITVLLAVCLKHARPSTPLEGAPELSVAMLQKA